MCACKHCNVKFLYIIENSEVADVSITSKTPNLTRFFIRKPGHAGRLKKADVGGKTPQWELW